MHFLSARQGPEYRVIPDYFAVDFEKRIIGCYVNCCENEDTMRFRLPIVDTDLMINHAIPAEVFAAAYLGVKKQDTRYYLDATVDWTFKDRHQMANDLLEDLESNPDRDFDHDVYMDVVTALNFYKMPYIDIFEPDQSGSGRYGWFYKNLPMKQVW